MKTKKLVAYRISELGRILLANLSDKLGISKTACLETAIRELARKQNVKEDR